MALLKTNYKDDILLDTSGKRKYTMITNDDGTVSFVDVTDYSQNGDAFGAADINATNTEVNEHFASVDKSLEALNTKIAWYISNGYLPDPANPYKYLYYVGNQCVDTTGGWSGSYSYGAGGTVIFNDENMEISVYNSTSSYYAVATANKIDLTRYSKIKMRITGQLDTSKNVFLYATDIRNADPSSKVATIDIVDGWMTLDISSLIGSYYVGACLRQYNASGTVLINEVYLME